ncbi:MAG: GNAT family N-acetyltransferase [Actinomycetaceae bacterium]|nr:N-acetyltransferase [Arcanobacterium sp.]MDD7505096.1 GNAT family N-acetyltransferase [Actinomycetaceae bacterium]MDY6142613.1 GNAT family N-acetyltransferase [Arcanobacterium sp.]
MASTSQIPYHVEHNERHGQWEARLDADVLGFEKGAIIGYASYDVDDEGVYFTHTVVRNEFGGQGIASAIVKAAFDHVVSEGKRKIVPICSFTADYLDKHPEYKR